MEAHHALPRGPIGLCHARGYASGFGLVYFSVCHRRRAAGDHARRRSVQPTDERNQRMARTGLESETSNGGISDRKSCDPLSATEAVVEKAT